MAFEKNPPPPGEEYEEIREQVRSFPCIHSPHARVGWTLALGTTMNENLKPRFMVCAAIGD